MHLSEAEEKVPTTTTCPSAHLPDPQPRFVHRYAELTSGIVEAVQAYAKDVREGDFPGADESY